MLIGFVAVWHGATATRPLPLIYEDKGTLGYTASGAPGVYDSGIATSGDPIFSALADEVAFTFDYVVEGGMPTALLSDIKGTASLEVELSASNGWKRVIPMVAETPLTGNATKLVGSLSLSELRTIIEQTEEKVGVGFAQYRVRITQAAKGTGRVSGQPINLDFNKKTVFTLDKFQLVLSTGEELLQSQSGTVTTTIREPWSVTVPLLGMQVSYDWMRFTSIVSVLISIGGLILMGVATRLTERTGEAALIEARYADLLVPTDAAAIDFGGQLVGVAQFADLARMARRTQGSIMHCRIPTGDQFLLVEPGVTYLYSVSNRVRGVA